MEEERISELIKEFLQEDGTRQEQAQNALAQIGLPAVPALLKALESVESRVRFHAAFALGKIGPVCIDGLIETLESKNEWARYYVARALGGMDDSRALEILLAEAKHKNRERRLGAIIGLGDRADARATEILILILQDTDSLLRRKAAAGLGAIGSALAAHALFTALNDESDLVRETVRRQLTQIGRDQMLAREIVLEKCLSFQQRARTLDSIAQMIAHYPDVKTLCQLLQKDGEEEVRQEAASILAWIKDHGELLRAGTHDVKTEKMDLLRAVKGSAGDARPDTLVRPSEEVPMGQPAPQQRKGLRERLQSLLKRDKS